jgi:tetratricopeptide (TPR) repeat protein
MIPDRWPDGGDPVSRELGRALDDARLRGPDDMTLRRGWAAVADLVARRAPARTRRWSYFAGGVASTAMLGVAVVALLWPRLTEPPAASHPLVASATVAAGESAPRRLTLDGGVEAKLDAASVMRLDGGDPRIEGGEVRFSVPHRQPGHPFVVRAQRYRVVVVGTKFGVSVDHDGNVGVDVDEGVVEVYAEGKAGRLARLEPGGRWRSPAADAAETTGAPADEATPAAAGGTRAEAPGPRSFRDSGASRHGGARTAGRMVALATPGGEEMRAPSPSPSESPPPLGGEPEAIARAALASGDAARALQIYRALAQRTGPAAENAAYEVGKILGERMGQPSAAVAAWRRYRADYPTGILRIEADVSIIETLARTGSGDEALAEATDFLRRHPESERRGEIARVAGDLYRARGDYRRAVSAYQIAIAAARPRDAVEAATFNRAACLVRLGDAAGPDAARAYLRAYPSGRFRSEASALAAGDGRTP